MQLAARAIGDDGVDEARGRERRDRRYDEQDDEHSHEEAPHGHTGGGNAKVD